jgi:hypothetical protein
MGTGTLTATGTFSVTVTAKDSNGFTGTQVHAFAVAKQASQTTVSASPTAVSPVQTTSATAHNGSPFGCGIVLALLLLPFAGKRRVREKLKGRMLLMLLLAGLTATLTGCGSTNGSQSPQTDTLTVTATSDAATQPDRNADRAVTDR